MIEKAPEALRLFTYPQYYMTKGGSFRVHTLSVIIQWREDKGEEVYISHHTTNDAKEGLDNAEAECSSGLQSGPASPRSTSRRYGRLRPTDRLILNALRARLPKDEQVTSLVTTRELMEECSISRRQVQICLRRLGEEGCINRLQAGNKPGNNAGFRYRISKNAPH